MNIESSNLSHAEYFHLNGNLSVERTEQALNDLHEAQSFDVREYAPYAQEARSGFVQEDFLLPEIGSLRDFSKRLRGDNKKELLEYIEAIENELQQLQSSQEYAQEQLENIIRAVYK